jgi:transposase-like protein
MAAPVLAVGDGALGFWKAVRDVFPTTKGQRCWWHKSGNALAALPKSAQPAARAALAEIYNAEDKTHARAAAKAFAAEFGVKWPKAAKITDDLNVLLAFFDYPAEHWIHLRTTNPIESTFATVRLRTRVTKGPRLPGRRRRDGVQADRVGPDPVAHGECTPPGRPGPGRCPLHQRQTR